MTPIAVSVEVKWDYAERGLSLRGSGVWSLVAQSQHCIRPLPDHVTWGDHSTSAGPNSLVCKMRVGEVRTRC